MSNYVTTKDKVTPKLVTYVKQRIERNKNFLCCFTGGTGSGKSYSAMKFGELISEKLGVPFGIDNVTFTPDEFMRMINNPEKMQKGSVLILDEAGVVINSRTWQSKVNMMINYLVQTFRHRNYIVILCVPDFSFVDSAVRKMFHAVFETVRIDYEDKVAWTKPLFIQVNQRSGNAYFKFLRFKITGEPVTKLERFGFGIPSKELQVAYEDKKTSFTDKLNADIEATLKKESEKGVEQKKTLTELQAKCLYLNGLGLTQKNIGKVLGVSDVAINKHLKATEKKGHKVNKLSSVTPITISDDEVRTIKENLENNYQDVIN